MALVALFLHLLAAFEENLLELLRKRGALEQARSCWSLGAGRSFEAYRLRPGLRGVIPARCTGRLRRCIYNGLRHAYGVLRRRRGGQRWAGPSGILFLR